MKRICVIDSGYRRDDKNICIDQIERSLTVRMCEGVFYVLEGAEDKIGHGTAILTILQQGQRMNKIDNVYTILKIFEDELECDEELLIYALQYVYENIECDILNLSLGITSCTKKKQLFDICQRLHDRNTIIISAFDNSGAVSYPAAFPCVIGVDNNDVCKNRNDIAYIEDSMVNIFAFGRVQRISHFFTKYMYVSGSSVACAHITRTLSIADVKSTEEALDVLYNMSSYVFSKKNVKKPYKPPAIIKDIKKAIVFPYNKEMHSVVKFDMMLSFSIYGVYDSSISGNVGKKILSYDGNHEYVIRSWKDIPWESDFDTIILGHLGEYNSMTKEDWLSKALILSKKYNKRVYCFDEAPAIPMELAGVSIDWPHKDFIQDKFGKLYDICCPILGIFGTGSKQGKYTLQLILRKEFLANGYKVGQIGSEPSSLLFGMDDVFHFGYNENFQLEGTTFIEALNESLNEIQEKGVDIIIAGCQSGTIPYSFMNIKYATCRQIDFLCGLNPDRVVLCANVFDDLEYICRTVNFIEALGSCTVIAIVLFPMTFAGEYAMIGNPSKKENKIKIDQKKNEIVDKFHIPCFELGIAEEMQELFAIIINSFT